jgi:hypothetical protein
MMKARELEILEMQEQEKEEELRRLKDQDEQVLN